jgi:DNA-directed RNA polymerase specialized sigma24 family protein
MRKVFVLMGTDSPYLTVLKSESPKQYEVLIHIRDHPEHEYSEVAAALGIPVNTVKTRLHRARQRILEWRLLDTFRRVQENLDNDGDIQG